MSLLGDGLSLLGGLMQTYHVSTPEFQFTQLSREDISTRLKLISTIREGEKLDTRALVIQPMGLLTSIQRRLQGCRRVQTQEFVWSTLKCASRIIDELITHISVPTDISQIRMMLNDLSSSLQGLSSLQKTYADDRAFVCSLGTLNDEIHRDIIDYNTKMSNMCKTKQIE